MTVQFDYTGQVAMITGTSAGLGLAALEEGGQGIRHPAAWAHRRGRRGRAVAVAVQHERLRVTGVALPVDGGLAAG